TQQIQLYKKQPSKAAIIPSELVFHIFKFVTTTTDLKSCILVCKSWCRCGVELLWHKPIFTGNASLIRLLVAISRTTQTFPYPLLIRRLNFSYLGENLSDQILVRLSSCERLERLTLGGCKKLTDESLLKLIDKTEGLIALDMSDIESLTDVVIELVGERCRRLQGLNVSMCKNITDKGVTAVASRCKGLRRIKLSGCENITNRSVIDLAENCSNLLELDLTNCHHVTDDAIKPVFENCNQLRELRLAYCAYLTEGPFIKSMPVSFDQLRILDLTSCAMITDQAIKKIVHSSPKLRNLVLAKCTSITDEGVNHITRLGKHLHYLHLGHCSNITNESIVQLARNCTRLRYLDLACCILLSDKSVFELSHLPKLRRIGLVKCALITDRAIYALIENRVVTHTLERVHLSYCSRLTIPAVSELVNSCHHLTHLSLTGVPAFLRQDVQTFCRQPPKEFTLHQRQVFCVFSGKGVKDLRSEALVLSDDYDNIIINNRGEVVDIILNDRGEVGGDVDVYYNYDFTNVNDGATVHIRGGVPYQRPCGWQRHALKVSGKYDNGNDQWLGTGANAWPVSYHGTAKHNAQSIADAGSLLSKDKRFDFCYGIYTTPSVNVAELYAPEFEFGGNKYIIIIQHRVNPKNLEKIKSTTGANDCWISKSGEDVRPYGICIKKKN
ncbi:9004_t:CDS:2, partial [Entrophospora sp. SA101]